MWVITMFDLPVDTKEARRRYTQFRKRLLEDGFLRMQFSVYARYCLSEENTGVHIRRVEAGVPDDGEVRILTVTEKQFQHMRLFHGKRRKAPEPAPSQLQLF